MRALVGRAAVPGYRTTPVDRWHRDPCRAPGSDHQAHNIPPGGGGTQQRPPVYRQRAVVRGAPELPDLPAVTVAALWRYPVKSMQGRAVPTAEVTPDGLAGDREWGVVDLTTGLTGSAKHPARFGPLLACGAVLDGLDRPPVVVLPDGRELRAGEAATDAALSAHLDRPVELRRAGRAPDRISRTDPVDLAVDGPLELGPATTGTLGAATPGTARLVDHAPLHLVSSASLARLADAVAAGGADVRRFRPNIVLDVDGPAFTEDTWVGRRLRLGSALLEVVIPTPRCVVPTLPQPGLERSPATLRAVAAANRPRIGDLGRRPGVGVYATVVEPGRITVGDVLTAAP